MNEFIEKLIGRLEYLQKDKYVLAPTVCYVLEGVKQYVNELAEEYKSIKNYNTLLNDIKSQLKQFIADSNNIDYNRALVEAIEVIDKKAEEQKEGCGYKEMIAPSGDLYFLTDCGNRHNGYLDGNRPYCGFCGKKIKVVE